MPTVVVLGASSFSGQDFVDLLMRETSHTVVGFSRSPQRPTWNCGVKPHRFEWGVDLNHPGYLFDLLAQWKPEYVVNFAAQSEVAPSWDTPEDWFQTNCVALAKLVNHLRKQTYLRKYLHVSSPEVWGSHTKPVSESAPMNPSTPYAAAKSAADMLLSCYCRQFGFPLVTVRSANVVGAKQQLWKIIPRCFLRIGRGEKVQLHGGGAAVKSWINVRDVSRGELAILESGRVGEVYSLSPNCGWTVRETIEKIARLEGKTLAEVAEDVGERVGQDKSYLIDSTKARTELGWKPTISLDDSLREVQAWVRANWDELQRQPQEYQHRP